MKHTPEQEKHRQTLFFQYTEGNILSVEDEMLIADLISEYEQRDKRKSFELPIPETVKAATLAAFVGLSTPRLYQMVTEQIIPKPEKSSNYKFRECVLAVCNDLRRQATGKQPGEKIDRARKTKAEADSAELTAAEKNGELVSKNDMRLRWLDRAMEIRRLVETFEGITPTVRTNLLLSLGNIKSPEVDMDDPMF